MPLFPKGKVPQLLYSLTLHHHDLCSCWRHVGVDGKESRYFAAHPLGEERHSFGIKGSYQMLFVNRFQVSRDSTANLDIAGAKGHAAERRVKNVIFSFK